MKRLIFLLLATSTKNGLDTFPDMSSPEAVKAALEPALTLEKSSDNNKDWDDSIFIDPSSGQAFVPNSNLSSLSMDKIDVIGNVIAFYAPQPDGDERLVGYADGHSEWVKEKNWSLKKMSGYAAVQGQ